MQQEGDKQRQVVGAPRLTWGRHLLSLHHQQQQQPADTSRPQQQLQPLRQDAPPPQPPQPPPLSSEPTAAAGALLAAPQTPQDRQQQASRLIAAHREETRQLMRELLSEQTAWHDDLAAAGVLVGVPSVVASKVAATRRRLPWRASEREALKQQLLVHGLGRWREVHASLCAALPGFRHAAGDVEDACWQLLEELQLLLEAPADRLWLARVMERAADERPGQPWTPGRPFKLASCACGVVARMRLLEAYHAAVGALRRSDAVAGFFQALVHAAAGGGGGGGGEQQQQQDGAASQPPPLPARWWDVLADEGLLVGLARHGLGAYEAVRRDPELAAAYFQGLHCQGGERAGDDDDDASWPPSERLAARTRWLCGLLARAVALALAEGLLLPLPGDDEAAERLGCQPGAPPAAQPAAAAALFPDALWAEDEALQAELTAPAGGDASDDDADDAATYDGEGAAAAAWPAARGRGRGRGSRGGRLASVQRLAAEAAAFAGGHRVPAPLSIPGDSEATSDAGDDAGDEAAGMAGGRRQQRLRGAEQPEASPRDASTKLRKELLAVLMTWGLPDEAAVTPAAAAAAAAADAYDWRLWPGLADLPPALRRAGSAQLTALLQELLSELETLLPGGVKPRLSHPATCTCVVCTTRRRLGGQQNQAAGSEQQAAKAGDAPSAAAAAAAGGDAAGPRAPPTAKPGFVLSVVSAGRLQERVDMQTAFRAALRTLPPGWHAAAFRVRGAGGKELPGWWEVDHDLGLVQGVVAHGVGNWSAMAQDADLPFRALPHALPDDKVMMKRARGLLAAVKKALADPGALQAPPGKKAAAAAGKKQQGGAGEQAAARRPAVTLKKHPQAAGPAAAAPRPLMAALQASTPAAAALQQLVQQHSSGPALLQALQAAAAAGNPQLLAEYLRQQQAAAATLVVAQQQQQLAASVLGKRSAAGAGLTEGGRPSAPHAAAAAAAAAAPLTPSATLAAAGAGGAPAAAAPSAAAAAAAAAALSGLSDVQAALVRGLPVVRRGVAGAPVMPLVLSKELMVVALGRVEPAAAFHTRELIFPVGFTASITYPSSATPGATTRYTSVVAQGGASSGGAPLFVVVAADCPGKKWVGSTPTAAWQQVASEVAATQGTAAPLQQPVDGASMMALSHSLVSSLIQELPGADACLGFSPEASPSPPQLAAAIRQWQAAQRELAQQRSPPPAAAKQTPLQTLPQLQMPAAAALAVQQQQQAALLLQQQMLAARQQAAVGGVASVQALQQRQAAAVFAAAAAAQQQQQQQHAAAAAGVTPTQQQQQQQLLMLLAQRQQQLEGAGRPPPPG